MSCEEDDGVLRCVWEIKHFTVSSVKLCSFACFTFDHRYENTSCQMNLFQVLVKHHVVSITLEKRNFVQDF